VIWSTFGGSLFLAALGAILRYGITAEPDWIDLQTTGAILMGTGAAIFLLTLLLMAWGRRPPYEPPPF
jgi:hypothetical protein